MGIRAVLNLIKGICHDMERDGSFSGQKAEGFSKPRGASEKVITSSIDTYELMEDEKQTVIGALLYRNLGSIKLLLVSIEERSAGNKKKNHFGMSSSITQSLLLSSSNVTSPPYMLASTIGNPGRSTLPDTRSGELASEHMRDTKDEDQDYSQHSLHNLTEIVKSLLQRLRGPQGFLYTVQGEI